MDDVRAVLKQERRNRGDDARPIGALHQQSRRAGPGRWRAGALFALRLLRRGHTRMIEGGSSARTRGVRRLPPAGPGTLGSMTATPSRAGLCASCTWARRVESARGSTFLRCGRSDLDPAFRKYPPLPVLQCRGHESGTNVPDRRGTGEGY